VEFNSCLMKAFSR